MLLQHLLEVTTRVGGGMLRYLFGRTRHHNLPSLVTAFWSEINNPVGAANHIEVVLRYPKILVGI